MSRNTEYEFVSTDTNEIISKAVAKYEEIIKVSVKPASPEMLFILWHSAEIVRERVLNNYTGNQNIPSRADGENLDALGEDIYMEKRPKARPAGSVARFFISAAQNTSILVPKGTKITDISGVLVWETTEDVYVAIGALHADAPIRCQVAGVVGNGYAAGQINRLIDVDSIEFFDRCENITASDGGANRATDEEYFTLMRESQDAPSTAGARGTYEYYAKKVSTEIADAVANTPGAGRVAIYVLMKGGAIAGEQIKNDVLSACNQEDIRPLTDFVAVEDAEVVSYDIDFTYYIPNGTKISSEAYQNTVQSAVSEYVAWQREKFGRDINPDELRQRVKAAGVKRISLNAPAFTPLRDGRTDNTVPQVAAVSAVNIVNGGYEDE